MHKKRPKYIIEVSQKAPTFKEGLWRLFKSLRSILPRSNTLSILRFPYHYYSPTPTPSKSVLVFFHCNYSVRVHHFPTLQVVLTQATHLYFDHPYEPDPEERGYYWAPRFIDTRKTFGFMPDDVYANADFTRMGDPIINLCEEMYKGKCVPLKKPQNIAGNTHLSCGSRELKQIKPYYVIADHIRSRHPSLRHILSCLSEKKSFR